MLDVTHLLLATATAASDPEVLAELLDSAAPESYADLADTLITQRRLPAETARKLAAEGSPKLCMSYLASASREDVADWARTEKRVPVLKAIANKVGLDQSAYREIAGRSKSVDAALVRNVSVADDVLLVAAPKAFAGSGLRSDSSMRAALKRYDRSEHLARAAFDALVAADRLNLRFEIPLQDFAYAFGIIGKLDSARLVRLAEICRDLLRAADDGLHPSAKPLEAYDQLFLAAAAPVCSKVLAAAELDTLTLEMIEQAAAAPIWQRPFAVRNGSALPMRAELDEAASRLCSHGAAMRAAASAEEFLASASGESSAKIVGDSLAANQQLPVGERRKVLAELARDGTLARSGRRELATVDTVEECFQMMYEYPAVEWLLELPVQRELLEDPAQLDAVAATLVAAPAGPTKQRIRTAIINAGVHIPDAVAETVTWREMQNSTASPAPGMAAFASAVARWALQPGLDVVSGVADPDVAVHDTFELVARLTT